MQECHARINCQHAIGPPSPTHPSCCLAKLIMHVRNCAYLSGMRHALTFASHQVIICVRAGSANPPASVPTQQQVPAALGSSGSMPQPSALKAIKTPHETPQRSASHPELAFSPTDVGQEPPSQIAPTLTLKIGSSFSRSLQM